MAHNGYARGVATVLQQIASNRGHRFTKELKPSKPEWNHKKILFIFTIVIFIITIVDFNENILASTL